MREKMHVRYFRMKLEMLQRYLYFYANDTFRFYQKIFILFDQLALRDLSLVCMNALLLKVKHLNITFNIIVY